MNQFFKNSNNVAITLLVLVLYTGIVAHKLPFYIMKLFGNTMVRIIILTIIASVSQYNKNIALVALLGFISSLQICDTHISKKHIMNSLEQNSNKKNIDESIDFNVNYIKKNNIENISIDTNFNSHDNK